MYRFLVLLFLGGCSAIPSATPDMVYQKGDLFPPTMQSYPHCRSYGCSKIDSVSLTDADYHDIKKLFTRIRTAADERNAIRQAVALFEQKTGEITGTSADIAGTYARLGHLQLDCVDESTNTTTYLILLRDMGVLRHHTVNALTSRAPILSGRLGPHRTAVITDTATGIKYAVDSWFHDNGHPPEIVALDTWKNGWHPDKP